MVVSTRSLHDALGRVVSRERLADAPLSGDAVDGILPRFVAHPRNLAQVGELITLARAEHLAVAPRGSGSTLRLGNPPRRLDLVIELTTLEAIVEYVPEDQVATVGAGCTLGALQTTLAKQGQMLALDPIGGPPRTIGGILASNASGPLRFRYGTGRDMLLGVRFVQADGTITWGGAKVVKSVTGYDVPKLFVGSLGTLGIIGEATLRLHPLPAARATSWLALHSLDAAGGVVSALLDSSLEPERVTLLNAEATRQCQHAAEGPVLLVSFGSVREAVDSQTVALARMADAHHASCSPVAEPIWDALDAALTAPVVLKLSSEPKRLVACVGELEQRATRLGMRASVVAQPGSGALECGLSGPPPRADAFDRELLAPLRDALASEGGSVVVQRAPVELKAGLDPWGPIDAASFAFLDRLKKEFDPTAVLNPGRFVGGL
jgi:glycolate oxidase FAD binding subunit